VWAGFFAGPTQTELWPTRPKVKRTHPHGYVRFRLQTKPSLAAGKAQQPTAGPMGKTRCRFYERISGDVSIKRTMGGA